MAARSELKKIEARKARLIKQNDLYRRELRAEAGGLREAAGLLEKGHSFYKAIGRIGNWASPFSIFRARQKRSSISKVWSGCMMGLRFLREMNQR